jgi:hypothetical protein
MTRRKVFNVGDSVEHPLEGAAVVEGVRTLPATGLTQIAVRRVSPTGVQVYLGWRHGRYWKIVKKADAPTAPETELSPTGRLVTPQPEVQKVPRENKPVDFDQLVRNAFPDAKTGNPDQSDEPLDENTPIVDELIQSSARGFAFDYKNPVVHLWVVHKFVPGEPVRYKGVGYTIHAVSFDANQVFEVTLDPTEALAEQVTIREKEGGKLGLRPDKLKLEDAVCHRKHGNGVIVGFVDELPLVKFQQAPARLMKGKKLRRVHLSPDPIPA